MSHSSQTRNYDESHRRLGIAASRIAGASLTRSKAPGKLFDIGTGPLYASCGRGAILTDVDGNDFIDMICALGAISLGYGEVARPTLSGVYSLPHWAEGSAANDVVDYVAPWASSVRFVKTGSEATHAAYRIAKAATGRRTVLIGDWSYHGWHEWCSGPAAVDHLVEDEQDPVRRTEVSHGLQPRPADGLPSVRLDEDRRDALRIDDLRDVKAMRITHDAGR